MSETLLGHCVCVLVCVCVCVCVCVRPVKINLVLFTANEIPLCTKSERANIKIRVAQNGVTPLFKEKLLVAEEAAVP